MKKFEIVRELQKCGTDAKGANAVGKRRLQTARCAVATDLQFVNANKNPQRLRSAVKRSAAK